MLDKYKGAINNMLFWFMLGLTMSVMGLVFNELVGNASLSARLGMASVLMSLTIAYVARHLCKFKNL